MLGLLYLVFSHFDKSKKTCGAAPSLDMLNIKSYIDGNYTQRITLNHLAGRFYINKYCLEAEFKKQFGITVIKYLNSVRFEKACAMSIVSAVSSKICAEAHRPRTEKLTAAEQ